MGSTTFSTHHLVPEGRAMLACSCLLPDGWMQVPVPEEEYNLDNPAVFIPISVTMAPFGAVVFTIAARPAFDDGSVQDWAEYLGAQNQFAIEQVREARVNRMPCILMDATMPSDAGLMRSRSIFLEDGRRLYNLGALAPDAIWGSVAEDFDRLLGSFALDDVQGITAAPMRQMTSDPVVDLTALSAAIIAKDSAAASAPAAAEAAPTPVTSEPVESTNSEAGDDAPATAADVALADDAESLDPEHPMNSRLRDAGAGLVPRVHEISQRGKYAVVAAAAIESFFQVPFGWHVIDDGKRTLMFDADGSVQINLDLRPSAGELTAVLERIGDALAQENPQALFLRMMLRDMPCLAVRDLLIDGQSLDQAYLARPSHREGLVLVCRVTADRDNMTRAVNTAEVVLVSLQGPESFADASRDEATDEPTPTARRGGDDEFAGLPEWWREAVMLERADRVDDAEQVIRRALDHQGVYASLASLHEGRMSRLAALGDAQGAKTAKAHAIDWWKSYAASATSGGEGAALSLERDERIAALGGED